MCAVCICFSLLAAFLLAPSVQAAQIHPNFNNVNLPSVDPNILMIVFTYNHSMNTGVYKPFPYYSVLIPSNLANDDDKAVAKMRTMRSFLLWFLNGQVFEGDAVFHSFTENKNKKTSVSFTPSDTQPITENSPIFLKSKASHIVMTTDDVLFSDMRKDTFASVFAALNADIIFGAEKSLKARLGNSVVVVDDGVAHNVHECDVDMMQQYHNHKSNVLQYDYYVDPDFIVGKTFQMITLMNMLCEDFDRILTNDETDGKFKQPFEKLFHNVFDAIYLKSLDVAGETSKHADTHDSLRIKLDTNANFVMNVENYWHVQVPKAGNARQPILLPPLYQFFVDENMDTGITSVNCFANLSCCGPPGGGFECCLADTLIHISAAFRVTGCDILVRHLAADAHSAQMDESVGDVLQIPVPRRLFALKISDFIEIRNHLKSDIKAAFADTCTAMLNKQPPDVGAYDVLTEQEVSAEYKFTKARDTKIEMYSVASGPVSKMIRAINKRFSPYANITITRDPEDEMKLTHKENKNKDQDDIETEADSEDSEDTQDEEKEVETEKDNQYIDEDEENQNENKNKTEDKIKTTGEGEINDKEEKTNDEEEKTNDETKEKTKDETDNETKEDQETTDKEMTDKKETADKKEAADKGGKKDKTNDKETMGEENREKAKEKKEIKGDKQTNEKKGGKEMEGTTKDTQKKENENKDKKDKKEIQEKQEKQDEDNEDDEDDEDDDSEDEDSG